MVNRLSVLAAGLCGPLALSANAAALELHPDEVRAALGDEVTEITVMEPHMKCGSAYCKVTYVGIPLEKLMQYYFPGTWEGFNGVIHFSARDGYLAAIGTNKVRHHAAYLTFSRADGKPFVIDNLRQNEQNVPLEPFYLVWDNLRDPELQKQGAYGWPYQVVGMELLPPTDYDRLLPADASPAVREGFEDWKTYCMATGSTVLAAGRTRLVYAICSTGSPGRCCVPGSLLRIRCGPEPPCRRSMSTSTVRNATRSQSGYSIILNRCN